MPNKPIPELLAGGLSSDVAARADEGPVHADLLFLATWHEGLVPWLGAILRVRQIHRANPALAALVCGRHPAARHRPHAE
jgi:hypothetical protein